jgi:glucoamylase
MPLVWAHGEYVKLLRSALDQKVFDLIEPVRARYLDEEHKSDLQVWLFNHKLRVARSIMRLRIETNTAARLRWTVNSWNTFNDAELFDDGLDIFSHEFAPGELKGGEVLEFTFYWTKEDHWEGRNFSMTIE